MTSPRTGVLVMAYGTPRRPEEIEPYYTDIRRGRPPTPEALADLVGRYEAIGGVSPLAALTEAQAAAVQDALDRREPGRYEVAIGLKHADPKIEETARQLADDGVDAIVGLVLAPHYSRYSIGQYTGRAAAALDGSGVPFRAVQSWATEPALIDFLTDQVATRHAAMQAAGHERVRVVFTAHSLPQRILEGGDPYPDQLRATAEAVAARCGLQPGTDWDLAWQSAGRTPEPWLGPDILDWIDGAADELDGVIVSSCGFVADHLEVLYDLDIEAADKAASVGLAFDRTASLNDHPAVMDALAGRVVDLANGGDEDRVDGVADTPHDASSA